jgi:hypothetical protein
MVRLSRLRPSFLGDLRQWRQCVSWELKYLKILKAQNENYLRYTVALYVRLFGKHRLCVSRLLRDILLRHIVAWSLL